MSEKKFFATGQEVVFYGMFQDCAIVADVDGDGYVGGKYITKEKLYDTEDAVTAIYIEKVQKLKAELDVLSAQKLKEWKEINEAKKLRQDLLVKLQAQNDTLSNLSDFIDGKITHYVMVDYSFPVIVERGKPHARMEHLEDKLLCLFGNSNGDLSWGINRYKDHSGLWYTVTPATSYDAAVAIWKAKMVDWMKEARDHHYNQALVTEARRHCGEIADEVERKFVEYENEAKKAKAKKLEEELAALKSM